jgi:hypothetical protein
MKKIQPYQKIAQVLRSAGLKGETVSPEEIAASFSSDPVMTKLLYRLSTYVYDIKKNGGVIRVFKDGRKVVGYELINPNAFDEDGRPVSKAAQIVSNAVQAAAAVGATEVATDAPEGSEAVLEASEVEEVAEAA